MSLKPWPMAENEMVLVKIPGNPEGALEIEMESATDGSFVCLRQESLVPERMPDIVRIERSQLRQLIAELRLVEVDPQSVTQR